MRTLILICLLALPAGAQNRAWHYVKTHRLPLAAAAVSFGVQAANATSTRQAERRCGSCVDMGFFGPHPTEKQVWFGTELFAASMTTLNLLAYHYAPDKVGQKFAVALFTIPLLVSGAADIDDNLNTPRAAARKRVLSK